MRRGKRIRVLQPGDGNVAIRARLQLLNRLRHKLKRRVLKHLPQRQRYVERLVNFRAQRRCPQRVAAEIEKVVLDANGSGQAEHLFPQLRQLHLYRCAWSDVFRVRNKTGLRCRQRFAVDLAVGR
ncbi:hypothetical protein Elgi_47360 [Paenibacillus elgii]|nr:hypothetical protein Elgi_47360 [Paenibacillus elgii]